MANEVLHIYLGDTPEESWLEVEGTKVEGVHSVTYEQQVGRGYGILMLEIIDGQVFRAGRAPEVNTVPPVPPPDPPVDPPDGITIQ